MEDLCFDPVTYSEYMDDLNYSQGFYVTPSEDGSVMLGGIRKIGYGEFFDEPYPRAICAAEFAVEEHNNKEGERGFLKFLLLLKLNVQPSAGKIYYMTILAEDSSGEKRHYQIKVWEKINTGYQVQIFRPAPYSIKSSDKDANKFCCVEICDLEHWMDESYLYYKCFYKIHKELLGVEITYRERKIEPRAFLWFKSCAESKRILKQYVGKTMPKSDDIQYDFYSCNCFTAFPL